MRIIILLSLALSLSACSLFSKKEVDLSKPVELKKIEASVKLHKAWSYKVGTGSKKLKPALSPIIVGDKLYAAGNKGNVVAIDLNTGKPFWKKELKQGLTAGVGAAESTVIVVTENGEVIALSAETGEQLWKVGLNSLILSAPGTDDNTVVVLTSEGKVHGLNGQDGSKKWQIDVVKPLLTVRGNAPITIATEVQMNPVTRMNVAYIGHDSGKLSAYEMDRGLQLWQARVGVPEGTTDLERMVDIDGAALAVNGIVYALSYQGGLMAVKPETGRSLWFQEASSHFGPAVYGGTLVITQADGQVKAFNSTAGSELWSNEDFLNRGLNAPVVAEDFVAFSDYEGFVHVLNRRDGTAIGRGKIGKASRAATLLHKHRIIFLDSSGKLTAFEVKDL